MFSFFYNFFLVIYALAMIPKILWNHCIYKKNGKRHWKSFFLPKQIAFIPQDQYVIWVHAVSLGETKAAITLCKELRKKYPHAYIIFSNTTSTGHEEAKKSITADICIYLPLDFSFLMKKIIKRTHPNLVIFIESDFWYHFAKYAKAQNARVIALSAKISQRSANRFTMLSLGKRLFTLFDLIGVQNETYKKRFIQAQVPQEKIQTTGNLKFSNRLSMLSPTEKEQWGNRFGIKDHFVLTIASTHHPEERLLLQTLRPLLSQNIKIFIAPRHPQRFDEVKKLLFKENFPFASYSDPSIKEEAKIILIDTMGFLPVCYQLSNLAIVGGSFMQGIGGHNILEPIFCQIPVVFGQYMEAQKDLENLVIKARAGKKLHLEKILPYIEKFMNNADMRLDYRQQTFALKNQLQGSLSVILDLIQNK